MEGTCKHPSDRNEDTLNYEMIEAENSRYSGKDVDMMTKQWAQSPV